MPFSIRPLSLPAIFTISLLVTGCVEKVDPSQPSAEGTSDVQVVQAPDTGAASNPPQENNGRIVQEAPGIGGTGATASPPGPEPSIPTTTGQPVPPQAQNTDALGKKVAEAEAQLASNPNDPAKKKALADALYQQGHAIMYDENLPPRQKYPPALKLFDRVLALEPTHEGASKNKDVIVQIYKSMGRPVPQ